MSDPEELRAESTQLARNLLDVTDDNSRLEIALGSRSREVHQLEVALHNRNIIGQAQGMLMERLGISSDQAVDYLKRASMQLNRKLVDVAEEMTRTRELPL